MSFSFDRELAAAKLNISTRTLDRYVKAGKVRSKKIGKKVFLNDADIMALQVALESEGTVSVEGDVVITETVVEKKRAPKSQPSHTIESGEGEIMFYPDAPSSDNGGFRRTSIVDFKDLFEDAQKRISEKDRIIQELSFRAGKAEAELKNSISLLEYKKTAFLLESAKTKSDEENKVHEQVIASMQTELRREKNVAAILMAATSVLLIATILVWFFSY